MPQASDANFLWSVFNFIRGLFTVVDVILFVLFCWTLKQAWQWRPHYGMGGHRGAKKHAAPLHVVAAKERWIAIVRKANVGGADTRRMAVIEADAFVDQSLKQMGVLGEHMADRLESLNAEELLTLNRLWRAHKLRNELVHEGPQRELTAEEAQTTLQDYEVFLKEIGAL